MTGEEADRARADIIARRTQNFPATKGSAVNPVSLPATPTTKLTETPLSGQVTLGTGAVVDTKTGGLVSAPEGLTTAKTPITQAAEDRTKSARDKLIDILLQRAAEPFDFEGTFSRFREEAGIPGLEKTREQFVNQIADVERLLDELETDVEKRTAPFLVTESQRRRIEAKEREPLAKELGIAERGLRTTEAALTPREEFVKSRLGLVEASRKEQIDLLTALANLGDKQAEQELARLKFETETGQEERKIGLLEREQGRKELETAAGITGEEAQLKLEKIRSEISKNNAAAAASIARASQTGQGRPLPAQRADFFASSQTLLNMLNQLEGLLEKGISTGPVAGVSATVRRATGTETSNRITFNALSKNLADQILRVRSGAQTGEKELDRMLAFLPDVGHQEGVNRENIRQLRDTIKSVVQLNADILQQTGYNVPGVATESLINDLLLDLGFEEE